MEWRFGVLPWATAASGREWCIEPLADYTQVMADWKSLDDGEGWVLPPIIYNQAKQSSRETALTKTARPAPIWQIPSTHRLVYSGKRSIEHDQARLGIAGFLLHALGCAYGVELQFDDWGVMSRMPVRAHGAFVPYESAVDAALELLPSWYAKQNDKTRRVITNALFLHNHAFSYFHTWEQFHWRYVAFDGCWKAANESGAMSGDRTVSQKHRFSQLANHYGLVNHPDTFEEWVDVRNNLVHEVTWGGVTPGLFPPDPRVYDLSLYLSSFTTAALLRVVSLDSACLAQEWRRVSKMALGYP